MFRRWFIWCLMLVVLGSGAVACTGQEDSEKGHLAVIVDYTQSLAEMVVAGHYDWINPDITAEHFSVQGSGVVNATVQLVHFNEWVSDEEALRRLDEQGLRSATLPELLAFGAKYPDKQKEFPIVAFGSWWQNSVSDRFVAYLDGYGGRRDLGLNSLRYDFNPRCCFLVSSK